MVNLLNNYRHLPLLLSNLRPVGSGPAPTVVGRSILDLRKDIKDVAIFIESSNAHPLIAALGTSNASNRHALLTNAGILPDNLLSLQSNSKSTITFMQRLLTQDGGNSNIGSEHVVNLLMQKKAAVGIAVVDVNLTEANNHDALLGDQLLLCTAAWLSQNAGDEVHTSLESKVRRKLVGITSYDAQTLAERSKTELKDFMIEQISSDLNISETNRDKLLGILQSDSFTPTLSVAWAAMSPIELAGDTRADGYLKKYARVTREAVEVLLRKLCALASHLQAEQKTGASLAGDTFISFANIAVHEWNKEFSGGAGYIPKAIFDPSFLEVRDMKEIHPEFPRPLHTIGRFTNPYGSGIVDRLVAGINYMLSDSNEALSAEQISNYADGLRNISLLAYYAEQAERDERNRGAYGADYSSKTVLELGDPFLAACSLWGINTMAVADIDNMKAFLRKYGDMYDTHFHIGSETIANAASELVSVQPAERALRGDAIPFGIKATDISEENLLRIFTHIQKRFAEIFAHLPFQAEEKVTNEDGSITRLPIWINQSGDRVVAATQPDGFDPYLTTLSISLAYKIQTMPTTKMPPEEVLEWNKEMHHTLIGLENQAHVLQVAKYKETGEKGALGMIKD